VTGAVPPTADRAAPPLVHGREAPVITPVREKLSKARKERRAPHVNCEVLFAHE